MRMSQLFSRTQRDIPSESQCTSHQLLLRAGFIRQLAAGVFSYLPLARRAMTKVEAIIREEMDAIGGQEITMPVVNPAEIWQETGRWYAVGSEMGRFKDKSGRDMVLAMTHEEVVADLARREIDTYRQLPQLIYHIQTKWRDDPRPRAGLIRVREFTMKDSYSLDADEAGLDKQYRAHYQAYFNIFRRCGLDVAAVGADTGMMGGSMSHEYMVLTDIGEDTLLFCDGCGYAANRQVARLQKPPAAPEAPLPIEKVATPDVTTIDDLTKFLNIPQAKTAKAVFMVAEMADQRIGGSANLPLSPSP
ncbi:MAG TPA: proline--tRNA ligase, partial [Anaerolineae bacterium]|nr:proline--tRNA ligase [Anaerolineae bacterium]